MFRQVAPRHYGRPEFEDVVAKVPEVSLCVLALRLVLLPQLVDRIAVVLVEQATYMSCHFADVRGATVEAKADYVEFVQTRESAARGPDIVVNEVAALN